MAASLLNQNPNRPVSTPALEVEDIQGILVNGYGKCPLGAFILLQIQDSGAAKRTLADWIPRLQNGADIKRKKPRTCANLAFGWTGLQKLGQPESTLRQFSKEFQEGMIGPTRSRILGDRGENDPGSWHWGAARRPDLLLMLYATGPELLEEYRQDFLGGLEAKGLAILADLPHANLPGMREHFGFADGISQPRMRGPSRESGPESGPEHNLIQPGEFILGYPNEYGQYTLRPLVEQTRTLPSDPEGSGKGDLGKNGSYLVFRQLHQRVKPFWQYLDQQVAAAEGTVSDQNLERVRLASKMVGRWPGGAPLATCPFHDDPAKARENDFLYAEEDSLGLNCPLGAHVRRTHPRDFLPPDPGSEDAIQIGKRHRILRRGRTYGRPLAASLDPADLLAAEEDGEERGLHFICFNANIRRQFEFVQQTWANNRKFSGLYDDPDPLIGDVEANAVAGRAHYSIPGRPARTRLAELPRFTVVRGGAYFFLPGLRALQYLVS